MKDLLLKNGTLLTPKGKRLADLLVREGKIVEMGEGLSEEGVEIVDCEGKFVLPGVIDVHVHLREPGGEAKEDFLSGTAAALAGGVTYVLDMPNNSPATISRELLKEKRELVTSKAKVDFDLYMGAAINEDGSTNVDEFLESDAIAYKIYVGSSTGNLLVSKKEALEEIFAKVAEAGKLICVHAEDEVMIQQNMKLFEGQDDPMIHGKIRSEEVAYQSTKMVLHLARKYETRVNICHLSTKRELDEFAAFKSEKITCEVAPHHLFLTELELERQGNFAKMNPPLRREKDCKALMEGIKNGLINMVATDHAPHLTSEKEQPYRAAPSGVPGLETSLPLMLNAVNNGQLTLEDVVRVMCAEPAQIFDLIGKGRLEVGADADLVIVDMDLEKTVENGGPGAEFTKCKWSPFAGQKLKGWPIKTMINGDFA
ncbi:dihydroorotase [Candidatus Peregrinibacteria bacterium]|jgi:dihydroorotase|nr:dihydroorotase [Candidatus Peregrinibacteria bacterium]MBT7702812.1 dihydroorotase [Candidatus Peregrinibacteria bacterium]